MHVKTARYGILSVRPGLVSILDIAKARTLREAKFFYSVASGDGGIPMQEPSF